MTNSVPPLDAFASASTMLAALQAGQISATELLEFHRHHAGRGGLRTVLHGLATKRVHSG